MIINWLLILLLRGATAAGQPAPVLLLNPSFEDTPLHSKPPAGWHVCGPPGETPPDIHPLGFFNVEHPPADGTTYIGMVVRPNGTWESLGQHLEQPLDSGQCYRFSLQAMRSADYLSRHRQTGQLIHYTDSVRVRLWGGGRHCERAELLAASEPVTAGDWTKLTFDLKPRQRHHYFIIEAYYPSDTSHNYRGNVLIDDASPLVPVDCRNFAPLEEAPPLPLTQPDGRTELEQLIGRLAGDIEFAAGTAVLQLHYYRDPEGHAVQENAALARLVYALRNLPDQQLIVAVRGPNRQLVEQRILRLAQHMEALGLPLQQFRLRPYRGRDTREAWAGQSADGNLFFGLN